MSRLYQPSDHVVEKSYICSLDKYREMHKKSLEDPESFWSEIANEFHWQTPYQSGNFVSYNFDTNKGNVFVKWLEGAVTNVCFNALDRNVRNGHGDKIAFYWKILSLCHRNDVKSLRVLGSVGEPINPEAWLWYYSLVGSGRCSIVDTFWQTETGGHVLTSLPGATPMKPGSAGFPFFGVEPTLLDENGKPIEGPGEGYLVFARPWPGIMRTLFGDHDRYEKVYFSKFPGYYCTGDGARRDEDGFLWVTGRIDDMLNVSGHLMSTAEVEGVLTEEPRVSEAAVVSRPHPVKGESLYCFVILNDGAKFDTNLVDSLKKLVRQRIGAFAAPDVIQYAPGLPKTRSGKIMRRILRKIALGDHDIGDTSTLADPSVVDELFKSRPQ
ncbi:acetyl-coenzyme A synthetase [Hyposmocoma kahamanoa]|uniref:acetyl-coenzyme A synthetase n=1 Tax=Hyposmocoma kahamanoa TaxID=1477025 RepID=UPI000E6D5DA4|nr:acetyl-coenzyme A synthetase [Hyposmocoma kahamanoa]